MSQSLSQRWLSREPSQRTENPILCSNFAFMSSLRWEMRMIRPVSRLKSKVETQNVRAFNVLIWPTVLNKCKRIVCMGKLKCSPRDMQTKALTLPRLNHTQRAQTGSQLELQAKVTNRNWFRRWTEVYNEPLTRRRQEDTNRQMSGV